VVHLITLRDNLPISDDAIVCHRHISILASVVSGSAGIPLRGALRATGGTLPAAGPRGAVRESSEAARENPGGFVVGW
jgi:hypothetical protein